MSNADDIMNSPIDGDLPPKGPPELGEQARASHEPPLSYTTMMRIAGIYNCDKAVCYWNISRKCTYERKCVGRPPEPPVP